MKQVEEKGKTCVLMDCNNRAIGVCNNCRIPICERHAKKFYQVWLCVNCYNYSRRIGLR